jgi:hypothetical protein
MRYVSYKEVTMKETTTPKYPFPVSEKYGPDPILLRKKGLSNTNKKEFDDYKKMVDDPGYMQFAINKIALELSHFLSK